MSGLVSSIADKFNLKESDVQAVFDAQRSKMEASREQETKDKVAALVSEGKLTQDQADKLNAKRAELQKEREAAKESGDDKTAEERKAEMDAKRTELKQWLSDNGIDETYAYLLMGGHGHGHGGHDMRGGYGDSADTQSDA